MISEGSIENERLPDLRRCERIRWSRPIIEHTDLLEIKVWQNTRRRGEIRILIWFEKVDYLIVLAKRKPKTTKNEYILLCTAYPVTRIHTKRKLKKEY